VADLYQREALSFHHHRRGQIRQSKDKRDIGHRRVLEKRDVVAGQISPSLTFCPGQFVGRQLNEKA